MLRQEVIIIIVVEDILCDAIFVLSSSSASAVVPTDIIFVVVFIVCGIWIFEGGTQVCINASAGRFVRGTATELDIVETDQLIVVVVVVAYVIPT